jgi:HAD superfamily hydrolase (TIGR01509 family)
MIKAIFLDFEGVITANGLAMHKGWFPKITQYVSYEEMCNRYDKAKFGEISYLEYVKDIPLNKRLTSVTNTTYHKGAKIALKVLSKKMNLYIASNHTPVFFEKELKKLNVKKYFKKLFASHKIKLAKPDPKFFQFMLKKTKQSAKESIFVDDAKRNLEIAKQLGFITVWVNNHIDDKRNLTKFKADYEIENVKDLITIVGKLNEKK